MQSIGTSSRTGIALPRPSAAINRPRCQPTRPSLVVKAKAADGDATANIAVSLALLVSLSGGPAFADVDSSSSYADMLKDLKSRNSSVQSYEKAAKTSSYLIAKPTPALSEKFSLNFSKTETEKPAAEKPTPTPAPAKPAPAPSVAAPKVELPSFTAPKFDLPKFEAPKVEIPKFNSPAAETPKFEAPTIPKPTPPAPVPAPKPTPAPAPVVKAPEPVKAYVPPPPPPAPKPTPPPTPAPVRAVPVPVPVPVPAPAPAATQGDFMERWQREAPPAAKKEEPKKAAAPAAKQTSQPAAKSSKRKGPLPLWFAEFLVLGLFGGMVVAALKVEDQVKSAYAAADRAISELSAKLGSKME